MITPRRTRLVRVPDLHAFRGAISSLSRQHGDGCVVLLPNRAAARQATGRDEAAAGVSLVTRDELYALLHGRLPNAPRLLTPFEREAMAQKAAAEAFDTVPDLPFRIRPGLVVEVLRFYDQLRRQARTLGRFAELVEEALAGESAGDRGTDRLLRQSRFIERTLAAYERQVDASGAWDEHQLRARLVETPTNPRLQHIVVTTADWIADPDGLFLADFDLLSRMPGLDNIEIVCTEAVLSSGFRQRIGEWLPGIEEVAGLVDPAPRQRPVIVVPDPDRLWFVRRDREEELTAAACQHAARAGHGESAARAAVVYKRPLPYLYLAPAVFGAAGVDYATADALPLAAEPSAASVDLALDAVETSFSRESVVALLGSPHFDFRDAAGTPAAISAFDRRLSERRYLGEASRLETLVAEWPADGSSAAAGAALTLTRALAPLTEQASASEMVRRLESFLTTHWTPITTGDPFAEREARARAAVTDVLDALAIAHASHHDPLWTFPDLAGAVRRWIQEKTFGHPVAAASTEARGLGPLWLLDDQAARHGDFDHLAIAGLIEHEWPERPARSIFYSPAMLTALGWPSESERRAAADARFLDLMASASRTVTLSTVTLDEDALVTRSVQLDEVTQAHLSSMVEDQDGSSVLVDDLLAADEPPLHRLGEQSAEWARLRLDRPAADRPEFHGSIGAQPAREWSVSAIETYLGCPFRFFARYVLGLIEEPEDEEILDPRRQGQFVHAVFERFFSEWQKSGRGAITPDDLDTARAMFEEVVDDQLAREKLSEAEAGLERTRLLGSPAASGLGEAVFRMEAERRTTVVERLLEFPVGGTLDLPGPNGPAPVTLRGKADRLDLLADGTFRLIDYKLGWPPDRSRALQLPIYGLLAERRLQNHGGRKYVLGEAAYLAFKGPRRVVPLFSTPAQRTEVLTKARERLATALEAIDRGQFPPTPDDVYRCESCSFSAVCRKDYVGN